MNKRARNRLIGITVIILLLLGALFYTVMSKSAATNMTVKEFAAKKADGKRVQVSGAVVDGSWNKQTNPMKFKIRDDSDSAGTGPTIDVQYSGGLPETFGDGVQAIITGTYVADGNFLKSSTMTTKCPSKYANETDAYTVELLLQRATDMQGIPIKVSGVIKAGSLGAPGADPRFVLLNATGSTDEVPVKFSGGLSSDIKEGTKVVVTGELDAQKTFVATEVALTK
ncbi:MAG: cytochrome c maturation protein CcmE [Coriobacteriia bacterium]|nr:cytochrome c maturation protein CcmE [Coriobacteriia bacterium]